VRSLVTLLVLVTILVGSHRAGADPKSKAEAQRHIDTATALFAANKPAEALVELQAAIELDPRPELLYAIGQAHASLGQCDQATKYFDRYLATRPSAHAGDLARQAIAACKDAPPPEPKPTPEPTPPPDRRPKPAVAPTPRIAVRTATPWYSDALGDALVGGGVIAAVIGVVLYRDATSKIDAANQATTYPERADLSASGHQRRTYAVVCGAGGAALVGVGILRYVFRARGDEGGVGVTPTQGGGVVTWGGRL
jgi:tetratricopeptide (TPR) repeat protein